MPGVGNYIISITFYMSQRQVSLCRNSLCRDLINFVYSSKAASSYRSDFDGVGGSSKKDRMARACFDAFRPVSGFGQYASLLHDRLDWSVRSTVCFFAKL
jgi:hypothetical protein